MRRGLLLPIVLLVLASCGSDATTDAANDPAAGQGITTMAATTTTPATTAPASTAAPTGGITTVAVTTVAASGPGYTSPRDATAAVLQELTPPPAVETPEELAATFATAVRVREKGCEVAPTAAVVSVSAGEPATAVVETTFGCDDSVGGARYTLTMEPDSVSGWVVVAATVEDLCLRGGAGEDLCV